MYEFLQKLSIVPNNFLIKASYLCIIINLGLQDNLCSVNSEWLSVSNNFHLRKHVTKKINKAVPIKNISGLIFAQVLYLFDMFA